MSNYEYVYEFQREKYLKARNRSFKILKRESLSATIVENGFILPVKKAQNCLFGEGGVLDSDRQFIEESAVFSRGGTIKYPPQEDRETYMGNGYEIRNEQIDYIENEVIYLGPIRNHWGHFLIDCSTRLWYMKEEQLLDKKFAFIVDYKTDFKLIKNIKRFLELYGLSGQNILFISNVTQCKKIIVPSVSYRSNEFYSKAYLEVFEKVANQVDHNCVEKHEKIYFTRKSFSKANRSEIGEELILDIMKKNGYHIISPENCTLDEQIAYIRNSKTIAAISGTIPHNMLFANEGQNVKIINKTYIMNMMQMDINIMKNLNDSYIDAYCSPFPVSLGTGPFLFIYNENIEKWIRDSNYFSANCKLEL